ncbi:hypothetical protein MBLNU457_6489t2 [Dothideomycetes sp. NU457]
MTSKPTIYVLDPYHTDALNLLKSNSNITLIPPTSPPSILAQWPKDATAVLVRSETHLTKPLLSSAKSLKYVLKQGTGVNNIDLQACKELGIKVYYTPGINSEAVAEFTLALALDVARRVTEIDRRVRNGEVVVRSEVLGMSLYGKTLGIVGMGHIGRCIARKWRGAMEGAVIGYDPYAAEDAWDGVEEKKELEGVLRAADVVTLHVPLTDGTRGLIGEEQLGWMKKDAILINAARGGIVDEKALERALREGKLWGAALDSTDTEPPTRDVYGEMLKSQNVILTPHVGAKY